MSQERIHGANHRLFLFPVSSDARTALHVFLSVSRRQLPRSSSEDGFNPASQRPSASVMLPATLPKGKGVPLVMEGRIGRSYELLELVSELPREQRLRHVYSGLRSAVPLAGPKARAVIKERGGTHSEVVPIVQSGLGSGRWAEVGVLWKAMVQLLPLWRRRTEKLGRSYAAHQVPALLLLPSDTELVKVRWGRCIIQHLSSSQICNALSVQSILAESITIRKSRIICAAALI